MLCKHRGEFRLVKAHTNLVSFTVSMGVDLCAGWWDSSTVQIIITKRSASMIARLCSPKTNSAVCFLFLMDFFWSPKGLCPAPPGFVCRHHPACRTIQRILYQLWRVSRQQYLCIVLTSFCICTRLCACHRCCSLVFQTLGR